MGNLVDPPWVWLPVVITIAMVVFTVGWLRVRDPQRRLGRRTGVVTVTLVAYAITLALVTLLSNDRVVARSIFLVPLSDLRYVADRSVLLQCLANVLLFVPFGLLLPLEWNELRSALRIAIAGAAVSLVIEAGQYFVGTGRETSTTDVALNVLGALTGYALLRILVPSWIRVTPH
jgi:glycopeptide antibiotics resistance protein